MRCERHAKSFRDEYYKLTGKRSVWKSDLIESVSPKLLETGAGDENRQLLAKQIDLGEIDDLIPSTAQNRSQSKQTEAPHLFQRDRRRHG